ncbi:MAG: hypothetical protein WA621_15060 [Candidatus Acidiferrum sp.]|jgi:hypothetical protein
MPLATVALLVLTLLNCRGSQNDTSKILPEGILKTLADTEKEYCEDQFGDRYEKGCAEKFAANLKWAELIITPKGQTAILVENENLGFCGTAGCAMYLFVQKADTRFVQVLGKQGDIATLKRFAVLKKISNGHYDVQVTWSDGRTHTTYRWSGAQYVSPD